MHGSIIRLVQNLMAGRSEFRTREHIRISSAHHTTSLSSLSLLYPEEPPLLSYHGYILGEGPHFTCQLCGSGKIPLSGLK